jgi:uncharacterized protein (TIGR03435 family)
MKVIRRFPLLKGATVGIFAAAELLAQATGPSNQAVSFEAATIKSAPFPADRRFTVGADVRANGFSGRFMTVKAYIGIAYEVSNWEWIIGPRWLEDATPTYSIEAVSAGPASAATIRLMLRNLLAERFHLKTHSERRDQPVYFLVLKKSGTPGDLVEYSGPEPDRCIRPSSEGMEVLHCSMPAFASALSTVLGLGRPVIDHTGLQGRFKFALRYVTQSSNSFTPSLVAPEGLSGPTVFQAIEEFGLKLEAGNEAVEVLVVDDISKEPTEN